MLAGAISLFRLLHLAIAFDLSRPARIVLDFYAAFFHPIADFFKPIAAPVVLALARFWGLTDLPEWWREAFIVYALIGAALFRHSIEHPDAVEIERNPFRSRAKKAQRDREREMRSLEPRDSTDPSVEDDESADNPGLSPRAIALAATFAIFWPLFPLILFGIGLFNAILFLRRAAYEEAEIRDVRRYKKSRESNEAMQPREQPHFLNPYRETTRWLRKHLLLWSLEMLKVVAATAVFVVTNAAAGS